MTERTSEFHRALNRTALILGGDRKAVLTTAVFCGGLAVTSTKLIVIVGCAVLWMFSLMVFRMMAKSDPQMIPIYFRARRYKMFYPARSTPFRLDRKHAGA